MTIRRLTEEELRVVEMMARSRLTGGEHTVGVVTGVSNWLIWRGWLVEPARFRAREVVRRVVEGATVEGGA